MRKSGRGVTGRTRGATSGALAGRQPTHSTPLVDELILGAIPDENEPVWPSWTGITDVEWSSKDLRPIRSLARTARLRSRKGEELVASVQRKLEQIRELLGASLQPGQGLSFANQRIGAHRVSRKRPARTLPDEALEELSTLDIVLSEALEALSARERGRDETTR